MSEVVAASPTYKTRVVLGDRFLRIVQTLSPQNVGEAAADRPSDRAQSCDFREFLRETAADGSWVLRAACRFGDGSTREVRRNSSGSHSGDADLRRDADFMINLAANVSTWTLDYLKRELSSDGPPPRNMITSVGIASIIPQCEADHRLAGLAIYYSRHDILLNFTNRADLAAYESKLCPKAKP